MLLVSVIIPVYNGAKYLQETVDAVSNQTTRNFEVIIVNDGSKDETEAIALNLASTYDYITYFKKENSGVSDTRNYGLKKANGEFVVFLDADDIPEENFLETRIKFLQKNLDVGFCGSGIKFIDDNSNLILDRTTLHAPGKNILDDVLNYKPGIATIPSNFMFRKALFDDKICFDIRLNTTADRMMLCKLALTTKCSNLPYTNIRYRIHSKSMYHNADGLKTNFKDNELYVKILLQENIVPERLKSEFKRKNYYMLAATSFKAGFNVLFIWYAIKYSAARINYLM